MSINIKVLPQKMLSIFKKFMFKTLGLIRSTLNQDYKKIFSHQKIRNLLYWKSYETVYKSTRVHNPIQKNKHCLLSILYRVC